MSLVDPQPGCLKAAIIATLTRKIAVAKSLLRQRIRMKHHCMRLQYKKSKVSYEVKFSQ